MPSLPVQLGFRMPAEWEPHEATWICWPHNPEDWPGKFGPIPWVYVEIVRQLHRSERVHILDISSTEQVPLEQLQSLPGTSVMPEHSASCGRQGPRSLLARADVVLDRIAFHAFPTNRAWVRDSGPTFLVAPGGRAALLDWRFNAWSKYPDWQLDDALPARIRDALGLSAWQPEHNGQRVVLEGGSIDVNGEGLLLTTEECLLSEVQCRNPGFTKADYERVFHDYLGVRKVLWLGRGIAGDDTHGHVDDLARFVGPRTVVTVVEEDPDDVNYEPLQDNLKRLRSFTDLHGRPLEVVTLPMPDPVFFDGQRLPASYANFYIANDRVLVPTFNDPQDRVALGILAGLFPNRVVVGIHAVDLVWGLGTLHCLTQQQPAALTY